MARIVSAARLGGEPWKCSWRQPISRLRYLAAHTLVTLIGIIVLATAAHVGTQVGVQTTKIKVPAAKRQFTVPFFGVKVDVPEEGKQYRYIPISKFVQRAPFWLAASNYACLGVFLLGLSAAMSSWDRYRWRTIGIVVGFYIVETVIELTGMAVEGCGWMLNFTFFSAYEPVAFITQTTRQPETIWSFWSDKSMGRIPDLGPMGCNSALLLMGAIGLIAAALVFTRRDIPAPL